MYYEERIIDGVLCWRGTPTGQWKRVTSEELTEKLKDKDERIATLQTALAQITIELEAERERTERALRYIDQVTEAA